MQATRTEMRTGHGGGERTGPAEVKACVGGVHSTCGVKSCIASVFSHERKAEWREKGFPIFPLPRRGALGGGYGGNVRVSTFSFLIFFYCAERRFLPGVGL